MSKEAVQNWRTRTKERMIEAMGSKCQCCGYNKCSAALEFHHIEMSDKELTFSKALKNPSSWSKLVTELRKCILLCANCHREVHHGDLKIPETYESFNEEYADYLSKQKAELLDNCPVCGTEKSKHQKTCSKKCAGSLARKVDWDSIDVFKMIDEYGNAEQVGKQLGISGAAVRKRIGKLERMSEVLFLTLDECKNKFPSITIQKDSLGVDKGIMFNTVGIAVTNYGEYKVTEYLPAPGTGLKQSDVFVVITDC